MQTEEPYSAIEATERLIKILDTIYAKAGIDKVDAAEVQLYRYQKKLKNCLTDTWEIGILLPPTYR